MLLEEDVLIVDQVVLVEIIRLEAEEILEQEAT
jgi:hypothetical protein